MLQSLISIPAVSRDETAKADVLQQYIARHGVETIRIGNNIVGRPAAFDGSKPTLMLNSHIDTVKPSSSYTRDPYTPTREDGRIYGLGSNDAGASVVSLVTTFLGLRESVLPVNLLLCISCEEEVGGEGGMRRLLPVLRENGIYPDMAIVGEPTSLQPAIAERGLLVLDCVTTGVSGHAARGEGISALYRAIDDISIVRNLTYPKNSDVLGPVRTNVTMIEAGTQHNVIPDKCSWVVDVRTTEVMTNEETAAYISNAVSVHTRVTYRSTRMRASVLDHTHILYRAAVGMGLHPYVSPTTSDMSLMYDIPSLKIGPGESARSHTANEYVYESEIDQALRLFPALIAAIA